MTVDSQVQVMNSVLQTSSEFVHQAGDKAGPSRKPSKMGQLPSVPDLNLNSEQVRNSLVLLNTRFALLLGGTNA